MKKWIFLSVIAVLFGSKVQASSLPGKSHLVMGPVKKYLVESSGDYFCRIEIMQGVVPKAPEQPWVSIASPFNCSLIASKIEEGTWLVGTTKWVLNPHSHIERWELVFTPTAIVVPI